MIRHSFTPAASCAVAVLFVSGAALAGSGTPVASEAAAPLAADAAAPAADGDRGAEASASADTALPAIVVTAQHLDEERSNIQTQTGASTYTIDAQAIAATPGGDNTLLNQVILQAPEVVQDSFGQFHIRGEHNGLQYRLTA